MVSEDQSWNPWVVKEVHPSDLLVDKFLSWDSNVSKPRLKAWHRAQQWVSDIIRLPFTPPTGHSLRISDKDNAFLYMTDEMSKNVHPPQVYQLKRLKLRMKNLKKSP